MNVKSIFYLLLFSMAIFAFSCNSGNVPDKPLLSPFKEFKEATQDELSKIQKAGFLSASACRTLNKVIITCIYDVAVATDTADVRYLVEKAFDNLPIDELELDTEEREYVAEKLYSLAQLVNVNVGYKADAWMYGEAMAMMSAGKEPPVIRTAESQCENCGAKFTIKIYEDLAALPDCWESVICTHCNTAVVITSPRGIGKSDDYRPIRPYLKSEYSLSQVKADIERARKAKEYPFNDSLLNKE